jgi:anti-sigma B factor antagonist
MTAPQLDDEAKSIDFDEVETVTLNLKDLEYISSSGLRVILALYKSLKSKGGNLKIVNVSNTIMFSMTGMSDYLDIEQG